MTATAVAPAAEWSLMDPWLLAAVPAVWLLFAGRMLREPAALPAAAIEPFAGLPKTLRVRLWFLPQLLLTLALSAFAVALARPVVSEVLPVRTRGIDILLVLDRSSSMMAADMDDAGSLTRVEGMRRQAVAFARARADDRVGLLVFARFPQVVCPLTRDQDALVEFLRGVETVPERSPENQTGIGVALAKATTLLEKSDARSRVVVLLSDGENNVPEIPPEQAARLAADSGIRVHCIGVGRGRLGTGRPGEEIGKPTFTALQRIAAITQGSFHEARTGEELGRVYARIDAMEKVAREEPRFRTIELFLVPFAAGMVLLLLQLVTGFCWIRRVP